MREQAIDAEVVTACAYSSRIKIINEYPLMDYPVSGDALAIIREANTINEDPYAYMYERVREMEQ